MFKIIRQLPHQNIEIQWVKGHQDNEVAELSVAARYNIIADELANLAHNDRAFQTQSPVNLPAAKCTFYVDDHPIQSHYSKVITHAFTLPAYKTYIAERHGWKQDQIPQVDWELLKRAVTNTKQNHVQMSKFLHDKLPTNIVLAKSNPNQRRTCHYCTEDETFYHLLCCHNQLSADFRREITESVETYMDNKGLPNRFRREFLQCIHISLQPQPPDEPPPTPACITSQLELGPRTFLKGLFTNQWRLLLTNTIQQDTNSDPLNGLDTLMGLIRIMWTTQLKLWESHLKMQFNSQHGPTITQLDRTAQYRQRIRALFTKRDQCLPSHRDTYFPPDVEEYLEQATPTQMRHYLHHYEAAISKSIQSATAHPMRSLFTFPGFIRHSINPFRQPSPTSNPTLPHTNQATNGARGAPLHHKHTRWRNVTSPMTSIRNFFLPQPKPD